jgi:hypothetical protein
VHGDVALAGPKFFRMEEGRYGHYDELGNWAAFQAMRRGIEGTFDAGDPAASVAALRRTIEEPPERGPVRTVDSISIGCPSRARLLGPSAMAEVEDVSLATYGCDAVHECLVVRAGEDGPTRLRIAIPERAVKLRGKARIKAAEGGAPRANVGLAIELDGAAALSVEPPRCPESIGIDLDLNGARELTLVASESSPRSGASIEIAEAHFEWKR